MIPQKQDSHYGDDVLLIYSFLLETSHGKLNQEFVIMIFFSFM